MDVFSVIDALNARNLLALLDSVCRSHRVTRDEVCGRRRTQAIALARHELWWHMRNHPSLSFSYHEMGRLFDRHHSSVLNGVRAYVRYRKKANLPLPQPAVIPYPVRETEERTQDLPRTWRNDDIIDSRHVSAGGIAVRRVVSETPNR